MRISDWSSDVCSSDLKQQRAGREDRRADDVRGLARIGHGEEPGSAQGEDRGDEEILEKGDLHRLGHLDRKSHTSELQSLMRISYAVFCLKKKNYTNQNTISQN